ncbi:helix-turn-helix transcriptional regulator [Nocardia sp. NPDC049707]|uniref:helix-turn-helix transcriptional regulator n=1 Tax=Nocardia sp. NPDC049707 TaxID=3154735 RepID=UPI00342D977A
MKLGHIDPAPGADFQRSGCSILETAQNCRQITVSASGVVTNVRFRSYRLASGLTQVELAELVCAEVERTTGHRPGIDAQAISRIECGETTWPRRATRAALVALLGCGSDSDLGLFPKRTRRDAEKDDATKRRGFIALTALAAIAGNEFGRVGQADLDRMGTRFSRLVNLDNHLGGADTFRLYYTELSHTERVLARATFSSHVEAGLTELAAQQAQQVGWAAFDAGFTSPAQQFFKYSYQAATEASSPELAANALVHIAYTTGTRDSVDAADAACMAVRPVAAPRALALLESRRAWSYASAGMTDDAARALDNARAALDRSDSDSGPHWCLWVDDAELDIMTGRVWSVLHKPDKAIAPLANILSQYPDHWARDKALYLTWLADAYFEAGDDARAISCGDQALGLAGKVASVRPLARVREIAQRFVVSGSKAAFDLARRAETTTVPIPTQL